MFFFSVFLGVTEEKSGEGEYKENKKVERMG